MKRSVLFIALFGVLATSSQAMAGNKCFTANRTITIKNLNNQKANCAITEGKYDADENTLHATTRCKGTNTDGADIGLNFEFDIDEFKPIGADKKKYSEPTYAYPLANDSNQEYSVTCYDAAKNVITCDSATKLKYWGVFAGFASKLEIKTWMYKSNATAPSEDRISVDMTYKPSTPGLPQEHIIDGTLYAPQHPHGGADITMTDCE
jgi:hypothetical protein